MKCMSIKEMDNLIEQISKKKLPEVHTKEIETDLNIDEELDNLLKEVKEMFNDKNKKPKEETQSEIFCSLD